MAYFELKNHQKRALNQALKKTRYLLKLPTGTGKTAISARWTRYQKEPGESVLLVITCTAKKMGDVAEEFVEQTGLDLDKVVINAKTKDLEFKPDTVYVVNYESAHKIPFLGKLKVWVLDEIHSLKNPTGKRNKYFHKHQDERTKILAMSATLIPNNLLDIFGIMRIVNDQVLGKYKTHFNNEYGVPHPRIKYVYHFPKRSYKKVNRLLQDEWLFGELVEPNLDEDGNETYKIFEEDLEFELGQVDQMRYERLDKRHRYDDEFIKLTLTKNLKLHQMVCSDLEVNERLNAFKEYIREIPEGDKVVVYTMFIQSRKDLVDALDELGISCAVQDGSHDEIMLFKSGEADVLIADYASASESINLHKIANRMLFYDSTYNYGTYTQARGRIGRLGQEKDITYTHLVSNAPIEKDIYNALKNKRNFDMSLYGRS